MNLNISDWKGFKVSSIFKIYNGKGITKEEIEENAGSFAVVQSGEENNGVLGKIDKRYCISMGYTMSEKPCLTVARSGSAGFVSFQPGGCVVGDSAKILLLDDSVATTNVYLFLRTILTVNRFKYAYGRKVTESKYMNDIVKLPVLHNSDGTPVIDQAKKYSEDGYIPDWRFMETYIDYLHHKPLTTKNKLHKSRLLEVNQWKKFLLGRIFVIKYGVNLELNACDEVKEKDESSVNFVSRTSENNGVSSRVLKIDGIEPQKAGLISLAGGGSVLSAFLQDESFYSGRDLYTLECIEDISEEAKLFLITVIEQNKYKYSYGRQANKTMPFIELALPIRHNADGSPVFDNTYRFSDEGYIPDWEFMKDYIRALPYGDRIGDSKQI